MPILTSPRGKSAGVIFLDEMGLTTRDKDGYRLRPDGKRIEMLMDVPSSNFEQPTERHRVDYSGGMGGTRLKNDALHAAGRGVEFAPHPRQIHD